MKEFDGQGNCMTKPAIRSTQALTCLASGSTCINRKLEINVKYHFGNFSLCKNNQDRRELWLVLDTFSRRELQ